MSAPRIVAENSDRQVVALDIPTADSYLRRARSAVGCARLSRHYTDSRTVQQDLAAMDSEIHRGLYEQLRVDRHSGLPAYVEWARIKADRELAPRLLEGLGSLKRLSRKAARSPEGIHGRQLLKYHYYSALLGRKATRLGEMSVSLRRVEPQKRTAWFQVVFDKLDATGLFVRYSIDLSQRSSAWTRPMVTLQADDAQHTEQLRSLVFRFTSIDAEFAFFQLAAIDGITVERVFKGTIGPFVVPELHNEGALAELLDGDSPILAMFAMDIAACDVQRDGDNDPLDELLAARLSEDARKEYVQARKRYGYKVFKDRKFVANRESMRGVREFCRQSGTQNIIYPLRRSGRR